MDRNIGCDNKDQSYNQTRDIDDTYIFDSSSGLYTPKTYRREQDTDEKCQYPLDVKARHDLLSIFISVLTVVIIFAYTFYARFQWKEMLQQTNILDSSMNRTRRDNANQLWQAERQMQQDHRAWIRPTITQIHRVYIRQPSSPVFSELQFDNVGHSPAIGISACVITEIVKSGDDPTGMDNVCSHKHAHTESHMGYLFPSDHSPPIDSYILRKQAGKEFPLKVYVPKETFDEEDRGHAYVVTFGRISYLDVFGRPRWTQFCTIGTTFVAVPADVESANVAAHPGLTCIDYNRVENN